MSSAITRVENQVNRLSLPYNMTVIIATIKTGITSSCFLVELGTNIAGAYAIMGSITSGVPWWAGLICILFGLVPAMGPYSIFLDISGHHEQNQKFHMSEKFHDIMATGDPATRLRKFCAFVASGGNLIFVLIEMIADCAKFASYEHPVGWMAFCITWGFNFLGSFTLIYGSTFGMVRAFQFWEHGKTIKHRNIIKENLMLSREEESKTLLLKSGGK